MKPKIVYIGAAFIVLSPLIGLLGTMGGIAGSFTALSSAEKSGVIPVGDGITFALISTIVGIVGSVISGVLTVFGWVRSPRS